MRTHRIRTPIDSLKMQTITATKKKIGTLLIRRPTPRSGEGIRGYALRVDYENTVGLFRPRLGNLRKACANLHDLAAATGNKLEVYCEGIFIKGGNLRDLTCKYDLGYALPPPWIWENHKRICPRCLAENGYMQGIWEIKVIESCLVHGCYLVDCCSSCHDTFYWTGGSLMECVCGAPLRDIGTVPVGPSRGSLDNILENRLFSTATDKVESPNSTMQQLLPLTIDHSFASIAVISFHLAPQVDFAIKFTSALRRSEFLADYALRLIRRGRLGIESVLFRALGNELQSMEMSDRAYLMCQGAESREILLMDIFNLRNLYHKFYYVQDVLLPAWYEAHQKWRKTADQSEIEYINSIHPLALRRRLAVARHRRFR